MHQWELVFSKLISPNLMECMYSPSSLVYALCIQFAQSVFWSMLSKKIFIVSVLTKHLNSSSPVFLHGIPPPHPPFRKDSRSVSVNLPPYFDPFKYTPPYYLTITDFNQFSSSLIKQLKTALLNKLDNVSDFIIHRGANPIPFPHQQLTPTTLHHPSSSIPQQPTPSTKQLTSFTPHQPTSPIQQLTPSPIPSFPSQRPSQSSMFDYFRSPAPSIPKPKKQHPSLYKDRDFGSTLQDETLSPVVINQIKNRLRPGQKPLTKSQLLNLQSDKFTYNFLMDIVWNNEMYYLGSDPLTKEKLTEELLLTEKKRQQSLGLE